MFIHTYVRTYLCLYIHMFMHTYVHTCRRTQDEPQDGTQDKPKERKTHPGCTKTNPRRTPGAPKTNPRRPPGAPKSTPKNKDESKANPRRIQGAPQAQQEVLTMVMVVMIVTMVDDGDNSSFEIFIQIRLANFNAVVCIHLLGSKGECQPPRDTDQRAPLWTSNNSE